MSSKPVELTLGNDWADKTTMQRHVSWGERLFYLAGLFVCFMVVWYVAKLETEVTSMKSLLAENTRQIKELQTLCREGHRTIGRNTENDDWEEIYEGIGKAEKAYGEDESNVEMALDLEAEQQTKEVRTGELLAFEVDDEADDAVEGKRNGAGESLLKRLKRRTHMVAPTPNPGARTKSPDKECKRACRNDKELPEGCEPCPEQNEHHHKHKVVSAHFVGYTDTVASVDKKNPAMATVGGLIPHWNFADWMDEDQKGMFTLNPSGNVTVHKAGIYFVYSQVQYYDENDFTGHSIVVNDEKFVSCIECPVDSYRKFSTCYIGGVTRLEENSEVGLNITRPTKIRLGSDTTYFGLMKLV